MRERPGLGHTHCSPPRAMSRSRSARSVSRTGSTGADARRAAPVPNTTLSMGSKKWARERKHLSDADVVKAGGWRSVNTMKRSYQQADDRSVLAAILEPRRLRDQGAYRLLHLLSPGHRCRKCAPPCRKTALDNRGTAGQVRTTSSSSMCSTCIASLANPRAAVVYGQF